jgi:hypothetical protein
MTSEQIKEQFYKILYYQKDAYNALTEGGTKLSELSRDNFIIPLVQINGQAMAQIRYENEGLYRDVQRMPFKRVSGVIGDDGKIPDINVTSLVKYGTLEMAKVAPTLENIEVKLYFREPNLKKFPGLPSTQKSLYADTYIWREAYPGFHVFNNDQLYGFEWVVLQDDYSSMDGVYNLHMNIEDGLGVCKFAGTQAPVSLKGVQYKVIITAKNLWNREYSLMENDFPVINTMESDSEEFAASVNAIRKYYREAVNTKHLTVADDAGFAKNTTINENGIKTNSIETENFKLKDRDIVKDLDEVQAHRKRGIEGAKEVNPETGDWDTAPHGILNTGFEGNIHAKKLDGLTLGTGGKNVTENIDPKKGAYIPFVDDDNRLEIGDKLAFYTKILNDPKNKGYEIATQTFERTVGETTADLKRLLQFSGDGIYRFTDILQIGQTIFNFEFTKPSEQNDQTHTIKLTAGTAQNSKIKLSIDSIEVKELNVTKSINFGGNITLSASDVEGLKNNSSIAYKNVISELLPFDIKKAVASTILKPNTEKDLDGNLVGVLDTTKIEKTNLLVSEDLKNGRPTIEQITADEKAFDKLGSALQALHELPLGTYTYKRGQEDYKQQLGIFIERVNQIRDNLGVARGESEDEKDTNNFLIHKRNSLIPSNASNIVDRLNGADTAFNDPRREENFYSYTAEEIKSIAHYLDLVTSKKELQQEIRNTVGILLKAAKETQDRLLDVETSIFGWDAKTVPGNRTQKEEFIENRIAEPLRNELVNTPLLFGLNRLMRALCLELFDTADLNNIEAEIESRVTDSDSLGTKATIKTRIDQVDEIMSVLYNQCSAMVRYYLENILNDEGVHSYVDMLKSNGEQIISDVLEKEDTSLLDNVKSEHDTSKDSKDKGQTWKNLPAKEDYSIEKIASVGFAQVSKNAHRHSPKKEETGIVRVPEIVSIDSKDISEGSIEHEDTSKYLEDGKLTRNWSLFKVNKTKGSSADDYAALGTYNPLFKSKVVAWDQAKLERMNLKLSAVTKAIYGVDDTIAYYPNRTEVLRRNITNLVDDLYPNRSFSVEQRIAQTVSDTNIFGPFKKSNQTLAELFKSDSLVAKENQNTDENGITKHTSIIPYFDNEIFNFKVENYFLGDGIHEGESRLKSGSIGFEYQNGKQISLDLNHSRIIFDTAHLVTDEVPFNSTYGTYLNAYSRIDMLQDLIGVEDCYLFGIYETKIKDLWDESYLRSVSDNTASGVKDSGSYLKALNNAKEALASTIKTIEYQEIYIDSLKKNLKNLNVILENLDSQKLSEEAHIKNLEDRVKVLIEEIDILTKEISNLNEKIEQESTTKSDLEKSIQAINEKIKNLENILSELNFNLNIKLQELEAAKEKEAKLQTYEEAVSKLQKIRSELNLEWTNEVDTRNGYYPEVQNSDVSSLYLELEKDGGGIVNASVGTYIFQHTVEKYSEERFYSLRRWNLGLPVDDNSDLATNVEGLYDSEGREITLVVKDSSLKVRGKYPCTYYRNAVEGDRKDLKKKINDKYYIAVTDSDDSLALEKLYRYKNLEIYKDVYYISRGLNNSENIVPKKYIVTQNSMNGVESRVFEEGESRVFEEFKAGEAAYVRSTVAENFRKIIDTLYNDIEDLKYFISKSSTPDVVRNLEKKIESIKAEINSQNSKIEKKEKSLTELKDKLTISNDKIASYQSSKSQKQDDLNEKILSNSNVNYELETSNSNLKKIESEKTKRTNESNSLVSTIEQEEIKLKDLNEKKEDEEKNVAFAESEYENKSKKSDTPLKYYYLELEFEDFSNSQDQSLSEDLITKTLVNYTLSRKSKTLQKRLTTTEAFLDVISFAVNYGNKVNESEKENYSNSEIEKDCKRFESVETWETLKRVMDASEHRYEPHRVFDLDLSESFSPINGGKTFEEIKEHNRKVWQRVLLSKKIEKGNYTPSNTNTSLGGYFVEGILAADPSLLPYRDENYTINLKKESSWSIKVIYVPKDAVLNNLDVNKVYLQGKVTTSSPNLYGTYCQSNSNKTAENSANALIGARAFQNQTEYNIYQTIRKLFTDLFTKDATNENSLYHKLFELIYPVGSIYMSYDDNFNPNKTFGGKWIQIYDKYLYAVGNESNVSISTVVGEWGHDTSFNGKEFSHTHTLSINETPYKYHTFSTKAFVNGISYLSGWRWWWGNISQSFENALVSSTLQTAKAQNALTWHKPTVGLKVWRREKLSNS